MILYFSGTGNSRYVAEKISQKTGDQICSIGDKLKAGEKASVISSDKPFVFVCPTYAWRIPRVVEDFIRTSTFKGNSKAYFILTCGQDTGNALGYIKRICEQKDLKLVGFAELKMPDNYVAMFEPSPPETIKTTLAQAESQIEQLADRINVNLAFPQHVVKGAMKSGFVNTLFYSLFVRAKGFHVNETCIACGYCAKICPLNNIKMNASAPIWSDSCTHCMACICGCPKEAIEYGKKTQGKARYHIKKYIKKTENSSQ